MSSAPQSRLLAGSRRMEYQIDEMLDIAKIKLEWLGPPAPQINLTSDQMAALPILEEVLQRRLLDLGTDKSGLYAFYEAKLAEGLVVSQYDLGAIAFLRSHLGKWKRIWEIGAGVGQLGALLSIGGFNVVSLERESARFDAMSNIAARLGCEFPAIRERWQLRKETFPAAVKGEDVSRDLAIVYCCAFEGSEQTYQEFSEGLTSFEAALIDFGALFKPARHLGEDDERAAKFRLQFHPLTQQALFRWSPLRTVYFLIFRPDRPSN